MIKTKLSADAHREKGTYRADRHARLDAPAPPPAASIAAPEAVVSLGLGETWDTIVKDLSQIGDLCDTDLIRLGHAMSQLDNSANWQERLDDMLRLGTAKDADLARVQTNINSSLSSFNQILSIIEQSVRLRPRPTMSDYLDRM